MLWSKIMIAFKVGHTKDFPLELTIQAFLKLNNWFPVQILEVIY